MLIRAFVLLIIHSKIPEDFNEIDSMYFNKNVKDFGQVRVCEIEISHMGKNNGNPDLVCE